MKYLFILTISVKLVLKTFKSNASTRYKKVVEGSNVYDLPCFLIFANTMTVLTVDFEMAFWSARSG